MTGATSQLCREVPEALRAGEFEVLRPLEASDRREDMKQYDQLLARCGGEEHLFGPPFAPPPPVKQPDREYVPPLPKPTGGFALYRFPPELTGGHVVYVFREEDIRSFDFFDDGDFRLIMFPECKALPGWSVRKSHPSFPPASTDELRSAATPIVMLGRAWILDVYAYNGAPRYKTSITIEIADAEPDSRVSFWALYGEILQEDTK